MIRIYNFKRTSPLSNWIGDNKEVVQKLIHEHGVVILRGLNIGSSKQFGTLLEGVFEKSLLSYQFRSTPRTELKSNVYTSTEYPPDQVIPQHNENAYTNDWPMRLGFFCLVAPAEGGATPVCDSNLVYRKLDAELIEKFESKGLKYIRNFSNIDLSWQTSFQTDCKKQVETICLDRDIQFEWLSDGHLRTSQVLPATRIHPYSGKKLWFNQAHLFHYSSLPDVVRENLLGQMDKSQLPRNVYFADGQEIEADDLNAIRDTYNACTTYEPWQKGDLMLIDNMAYTHGRQSYTGPRKVLVGMAMPFSDIE